MMIKKHIASFVTIFIFCIAGAEAQNVVPDFKALIQKAEYAFYEKFNRKRTDFWVARFLGLSSRYPEAGYSIQTIEPFLKKRKLTPKAFIPDDWEASFVQWFETSVHERWAVDEKKVREKHRSFEIAESVLDDKFFAKIIATPEIEMWHIVHEGVIKKPLWMAMASHAEKPALFFGKILAGTVGLPQAAFVFLNTERRNVHYVWKPDFYDIDGDGVKEVWARFNLGWGNGFAQILEIYKIKNGSELVLFKRFKAEPEGMVRRLSDGKVELATARASHDRLSRMQYDIHHVETWEFKDGEFKRSSEKDIPFIYRSPDWKSYL